jgi:heat shock protein HslJ
MYKLFIGIILLSISKNGFSQNGVSINAQWIIAHYYQNDSVIYPPEKNCYISIEDSIFDGKAGCRNINGKLKITEQKIQILKINSKNLICKNSKLATLFIANLLKANRYSINAAELTLYCNKKILMVLESWRL